MPEADRESTACSRRRRRARRPPTRRTSAEPRRRSTTTSNTRPRATAHQLALARVGLEVDAAQRPLAGARVVVLHELRGDAVIDARRRRGRSPRRSRARRRARWARAGRVRRVESQAVAYAGRRLGSGRRKIASPCRGPPPCPRPPAAIRRFPRTSPHASRSSHARRRTSPSTSSTTSTKSPSTPPRSSRGARTRPARPSCASARRSASRASPSCRRRRARSTATTTGRRRRRSTATPLFSLDQSPFEQAVAADHVNVEDTARRVSRSEVDGAIEAIAAAEKILIAGTDQMAFFASYLRHLLMLLDVRAEIAASPSPGGAQPARPDRRAHAGDRPVRRPPAPARRCAR